MHWLHAILTFFTCGMWGIGWAAIAIYTSSANASDRAGYQQQAAEWHAWNAQQMYRQHH